MPRELYGPRVACPAVDHEVVGAATRPQRVLIDVRTVDPSDDLTVTEAVRAVLEGTDVRE